MISYDEQFFARVFDSVTDPMAIYDSEYKIIRANQALLDRFRLPLEKVINRYCYELFYDRTTTCKDCHVKEVFEHGESRMLQKQISAPDGSQRIYEVHSYPVKDTKGHTIQAIEHARDITERKHLEDQLLSSKKLNDKIINSITDNLVVIDPKTLRIIQANESFCKRVGLEHSAVTTKRCHELMRNSSMHCEINGFECPVQDTIRSKRSSLSDKVYPNASGEDRVLQIATYPIFDKNGDINSIVRLERDVTETREMEKALAFRSKELQRAKHQLEELFKISRQVSAKNSLSEIVDYVHDIIQGIFPDSNPLIFLLDDRNRSFLSLEGCKPVVLEPFLKALQQIEQSGLIPDFFQYLQKISEFHIIDSINSNDIPPFLNVISKNYANWFGLPISLPQQCIGYFVLGFPSLREFSREDMHFFLTLFNQVAGHIRHLIIHESELNKLRQRVGERTSHGKIIGHSDEMQKIYELIDLVSASDAIVLITGENGTGKELVAQAIHRQSYRKDGPFVVASCSAYSPTLLESELFGHEKGAFTGAIKMKKGRIERAQGGILFLDEIGDIAPATQVLLLRFLQDHCFERVGGEETIEADVRVLAATNRDLFHEVEAGRFRNDLYYRLNVITLHLPPLRDRKEDIPRLCSHFLEKCSLKENKDITSFSPGAMQILMDYEWPGNVRQLENAVSHAVILAQGQSIEREHLPQFLKQSIPEPSNTCLAENERRLILNVLQESDWNKHEAARRLEISRSTLYSKIRRHGIEKGTF
ncbi:MAG: sigma 54-interacting transcriptional regulator [Deltaproteobacteria bacterium]|jgi:PAS domain S-box-containing protein|nr:sigma 54-interacting transcriptional regulator [Deltaproteobacteria bacterium]